MTRSATFRQSDLARAIRAAEACGKSVRVLRDGSFEIIEKGAETKPEAALEAIPEFSL